MRSHFQHLESRQLLSAATQLAITQQPVTSVAGVSNIIEITIEDTNGALVPDNSDIDIIVDSGPANNPSIFTVTATNGVALFNAGSFTKAGTYTLRVSSSGLTDALTSSYDVTAAAAAKLEVLQSPGNRSAGPFGNIVVAVEDQFGNVVTTDSSLVTLAQTLGPQDFVGDLSQNAVNGIATFTDLRVNRPGTYGFSATDGALIVDDAAPFVVGAHLKISRITTGSANNTLPTFQVSILDSQNRVIVSDNSDITLALSTSPAGAALAGVTTVTALNGVATFTGALLHTAGQYKLVAYSGDLTPALSNSFNVNAAPATAIAFVIDAVDVVAGQHMNPTLTVKLTDAFGNLATSSHGLVTLSSDAPDGPYGRITAPVTRGYASFPAFYFKHVGNFKLTATYANLTADSANFNVTADAQKTVTLTNTAGVTANVARSFLGHIVDKFGNQITTSSTAITLLLLAGPARPFTLITQSAVAGTATFDPITFTTPGNYRLRISSPGLTPSLITIHVS